MTRWSGGSSPITGEAGGNRCRFAGRRTGCLGFRRAGIALGRFRDGNEQEEPEQRQGYIRKIRTLEHFADYILQAGDRQQLSFRSDSPSSPPKLTAVGGFSLVTFPGKVAAGGGRESRSTAIGTPSTRGKDVCAETWQPGIPRQATRDQFTRTKLASSDHL